MLPVKLEQGRPCRVSRAFDGHLTRWKLHKLTGQETALVSALNSGAFVDNFHHAKYDLTKQAVCKTCGVSDLVAHWFECPRFREAQDELEGLVPRSSFTGSLKSYFQDIPDATQDFFCVPQVPEPHIFTDGSCFADSENQMFHIAAWATVDASSALRAMLLLLLLSMVCRKPLVGPKWWQLLPDWNGAVTTWWLRIFGAILFLWPRAWLLWSLWGTSRRIGSTMTFGCESCSFWRGLGMSIGFPRTWILYCVRLLWKVGLLNGMERLTVLRFK